jgi:hypothetical protein
LKLRARAAIYGAAGAKSNEAAERELEEWIAKVLSRRKDFEKEEGDGEEGSKGRDGKRRKGD